MTSHAATRLAFVAPMMPALVEAPPEGDDWLHELKYDGYRTQLILDGELGAAFTRRGHDWSHLYRRLIDALRGLGRSRLHLDGEVIVQNPRGLSDFRTLRSRLARRRPDGLIFMAFDLLHLDARDLRRDPVEDRRGRLADLLGGNRPDRPIQYSDHVVGGGPAFFALADRAGAEGIVSKRIGSRYRAGPTRSWLKTKAFAEEEMVVVGTSKGDLAPVALLAREAEGGLEYAGAAMVTFSESERERFWRANERLKTAEPALPMEPRPETSWLRPEMRVLVRHLRGEEVLRHATVKAITRLPPPPSAAPPPEPKAVRGRGGGEPGWLVGSGEVPERQPLAAYYRKVAPLILPHLARRPLNLFRCHGRYCVFQRNRSHPASEFDFGPPIRTLPIRQKNGRVEDYLYVEDLDGILACIEAETVEFHGWGARIPDFERPDRVAIDLDPGEGVGFEAVKLTAQAVRERLAALGLESFAMLTGGKGIHVVLPFAPIGDWDAVRGFAQAFCERMAAEQPDLFTTAIAKASRRGRIFLDYLRNQRTATAILPYSARVRPGAPVAAPVSWDELTGLDSPAAFTLADAALLLKRARSRALKGWGQSDQRLPASA